jgi:hypothetical protein
MLYPEVNPSGFFVQIINAYNSILVNEDLFQLGEDKIQDENLVRLFILLDELDRKQKQRDNSGIKGKSI